MRRAKADPESPEKKRVIFVTFIDADLKTNVKAFEGNDLVVFTDKMITLNGVKSYQRTGELYIHRISEITAKDNVTKVRVEDEIACFAQGQWKYWEIPTEVTNG